MGSISEELSFISGRGKRFFLSYPRRIGMKRQGCDAE
jgi:hypothetical protein